MGRLWRKQEKLEAQLGEDGVGEDGEKPEGMYWRTYERIYDRINEVVEEAKDGLFCVQAARLLGMNWA